MLLNDDEVEKRLNSPLNLINRLRSSREPSRVVTLPPKTDELVENLEDKIALAQTSSVANRTLSKTVAMLETRLEEADVKQLSTIAKDMGYVIANVNRARDRVEISDQRIQIVVYAPQVRDEAEFGEVIQIHE